MQIVIDFILHHPVYSGLITLALSIFALFIYDISQKKHTITHNFPLVGHIRYLLETIGPEMRQYMVANDKEEMPFNRIERRWIYASSKRQNNYFGFGTTEQMYEPGYPVIKNAAFPVDENKVLFPIDGQNNIPCFKVLGAHHRRKRPYRPSSIINLSAMSFGSLGKNAISALSIGAKAGGCYQNTGEGGVSRYHKFGGELVFQIGTGYFGVRDKNGKFSLEILVELINENEKIRAIEIKISQGAKPGKGGVLPAKKVNKEISEARGVPEGEYCISPSSHTEFNSADTLIDFIEKLADATGLPVGIKAAVGRMDFWQQLARKMKTRKAGPDFITIDGSEGGTGAAPLTFSDHVSLPFKIGFSRVYQEFMKYNLDTKIVFIGSAKLGFPDRCITALAMGCDLVAIAREGMFSIGCIQAQKCHTDKCPAGIATQNSWLQAGLNIENKAERFANYIRTFRKDILDLSHTAGYQHPAQFTARDIEISRGLNRYFTLAENLGYTKIPVSLREIEALKSELA